MIWCEDEKFATSFKAEKEKCHELKPMTLTHSQDRTLAAFFTEAVYNCPGCLPEQVSLILEWVLRRVRAKTLTVFLTEPSNSQPNWVTRRTEARRVCAHRKVFAVRLLTQLFRNEN